MAAMLAFDVKVLTNQLQQQSLDDRSSGNTAGGTTSGNITLISPDVSGLKLSESAQAKLGGHNSGKKVWSVPLNPDSAEKVGTSGQISSPTTQCGQKPTLFRPSCGHKKPVPACSQCDIFVASSSTNIPISSERQPKKRHCRVPQETEISIPPSKSTWQPQGSGLWKPVAMTTMTNVRNCSRAGLDGKFDVRTVRWSPTECRNYEFSSLAPTLRHMETGHITPDDLLTPPESPVPRPNSVYSDGAISPFTGDFNYNYYSAYSNIADHATVFNRVQQMQEFRHRSLSVEDKISFAGVAQQPTLTGPAGSGSLSSVVPGALHSSVPSSPHHHRPRVQRCRSQPSFYDRKSGRRRRRDLRPTLNFHKMTETAYGLARRMEAVMPGIERQGSRFREELDNVMSLSTIASSPRESDILRRAELERHHGNSATIHEHESASRAVGNSYEEDTSTDSTGVTCSPVKLLGDQDDDDTDMEVFQLTEELDLEQIENH